MVIYSSPPLWCIIDGKPAHQLRFIRVAPNLLIASRLIPPRIHVPGAEVTMVCDTHTAVPRRADNPLLKVGRKESACPSVAQFTRPACAENDPYLRVVF